MNIGDNGFSMQYTARYKTKPQQAINMLINEFITSGLSIPDNKHYSIRPKFKRVDILYNPETKMFCGLHEELS